MGLTLNQKKLRILQIPLPPLETQKKNAEILDKADELRQNVKKILEKYDRLAQSVFLEMFGDPIKNPLNWETENLGSLSEIRRGASPRPIADFVGGNMPWIKISDGTKGDDIYIESTKESITETGALKSVILEPGSLIFANCGVSLGFARILKIKGCIHDGWLSFEDINEGKLNKMYLLKLLNSISNYFRLIAPEGTQPNLNTGIMKQFPVPKPPIGAQNKFENIVLELNTQKKLTQISIQKSEDLFQSLLQRAFRGEL
jgi:type I restriction enzyme S subunit